ncbi:S8 family serine peptidase [Actinophytocola sp.]|uniref:S8 family serine peptidase n=1 Tax=Actinophytocola sp. TaxID=1872138 RepID=UPI002ED0C3E5
MHLQRPLHRLLAVLTGLVVAAGVSATTAPAAPTAAASVAGPALAPAGPATDVTLITGDVATVTRDVDGLPRATMRPAEGTTGFTTLRRGSDLYVVPSSVEHLVPETLDLELFNVTGLLAQGYGDAETDTLPVIVRGQTGLRTGGTALPSIDATAVDLPKKTAFTTVLAAGGVKVWLDRRVSAAELDGNLTRIGAPQAWDAGLSGAGVDVAVLDTGVDADHPDLRGKVIEQANFTDDPTAADGHGHGTHVASIIGGTGAAAGGVRKGVAYGARLLSGKVLAADGRGQLSWVIRGMEWAAARGADVVNISLGGKAGDGDDPTAQALDRLATDTDTLFVVAAGNDGPGSSSVGTPGVAASALTVGAANTDGLPPYFSGQGPARGSFRAKPDVTAPGVSITAAQTGGDGYTQMTGTSQAAPHVAGAAALLAERHPDWDWQRIKNTLMTTADAKTPTPTPYAEGAGHIDLAGALADTLHLDRGNVDFGYLRHGDNTAQRTITLHVENDGTQPETVTISDEVRDPAGRPAPDNLVTATPAQFTVAPGQTVPVTVTLTPGSGGKGVHTGAVTLTRPGKQPTRMPLGFYNEAPRQNIALTVLNRHGQPDAYGTVWLANMAEMHPSTGGGYTVLQLDENGRGTARMAPGPISAVARIVTPASGATPETVSFAGTPELTVDRDLTYTIDARKAKQLKPVTVDGARTTVSTVSLHYGREDARRDGGISDGIYATGEELARGTVFVQPTTPVRHGRVSFETRWELNRGTDRYAVVLGGPTVPNPPTYRASRSSFARVDADYRSLGGQPDSYRTYRQPDTDLVYATQGWLHPLPAPTKRTEWVTASPNVRWRQCVAGPHDVVAVLCTPTTTYRPGERRPAVWFRSPAPAVTTASHNRERIELPVDLSDGAHEGSLHEPAAAGNRTYRLYRNGTELPRFGDSWYFDSPPEPATFRLEHTSTPDPTRLPIASSTSTAWTFPSQAPTDPEAWDTKPRLLSIDYQPGTDAHGRLPAWHLLDLDIRVTSMAGGTDFRLEPGTLRFWASTDQGKRWHQGIVVPGFDGTYRVLVPGVITRPGQHISVRAEATAAENRTIKQTLLDAYPVR